MTRTELTEVLRLHTLWLRSAEGGKRADLTGADLTGADLCDARLTGADLTGEDLCDARLTGADLTGEDLCDARLTRANLSGANLTGANLTGARLTGANLTGARLTGARLTGANLTRANLSDANLSDANLRGANLRGANLTDANLRGANLTDANLRGAHFCGVRGVPYASVSWPGHGEAGRTLLAVRVGGVYRYFCGCFAGSEADLRAYIAEREERYRATRTLTADIVARLMAAQVTDSGTSTSYHNGSKPADILSPKT